MFPRAKRAIKRFLGDPASSPENEFGEKGSDYYNGAFESVEDFHVHYTKSYYYFLWTLVIDKLRDNKSKFVLEIACGPGQLAKAITDAIPDIGYVGFDFSEVAIEAARRNVPSRRFELDNALTTKLFDTADYDTVISTEFLEHVERDIEVLKSIKPGTRFVGTVPNFPFVSHVRHFRTSTDVMDRYSGVLEGLQVRSIAGDDKGKVFYIMTGTCRT